MGLGPGGRAVTPAEKRARAKMLRAEARQLVQDAEADEAIARREEATARARVREAEQVASLELCRPVWRDVPTTQGAEVLVVRDVVNGRILVGRLAGGEVVSYPIRGGGYREDTWGKPWAQILASGRIDARATLVAWREHCARRKEDR